MSIVDCLRQLHSLILCGNLIDDEGAKGLGEVLKHSSGPHYLDLIVVTTLVLRVQRHVKDCSKLSFPAGSAI